MDGVPLGVFHGTEVIHRLADNIQQTAQRTCPHRHRNRPTVSMTFMPRTMPSVATIGTRAHPAFALVARFRNHIDGRRHVEALRDNPQSLVNRRQL